MHNDTADLYRWVVSLVRLVLSVECAFKHNNELKLKQVNPVFPHPFVV